MESREQSKECVFKVCSEWFSLAKICGSKGNMKTYKIKEIERRKREKGEKVLFICLNVLKKSEHLENFKTWRVFYVS